MSVADNMDVNFLPLGSQAERLAVMNAVRLVPGAQKLYALPPTNAHDVDFDLVEVDSVPLGQPFSVNVHIHVNINNSESYRINCFIKLALYLASFALMVQ